MKVDQEKQISAGIGHKKFSGGNFQLIGIVWRDFPGWQFLEINFTEEILYGGIFAKINMQLSF